MVSDEEHATLFGNILYAADANAVEALEDKPAEGMHEAIAQGHRLMATGGAPGEGHKEDRQQEQAEADAQEDDHQQEPTGGVKQGHPAKVRPTAAGASESFRVDPSPPVLAL